MKKESSLQTNSPAKLPVVAEKIVIESTRSFFRPPALGEEFKQRLTLMKDGSAVLTRWFIEEDSLAHFPALTGKKEQRRYRDKPTARLMELIAAFLKEAPDLFINDAGTWQAEITYSDGEKQSFDGTMLGDIEVQSRKLSALARKTLGSDDLWLFSGL